MPTVVELKESLRALGLKLTGDKAALEGRLSRAKAGTLTSENKKRAANAKKPASVGNITKNLEKLRVNEKPKSFGKWSPPPPKKNYARKDILRIPNEFKPKPHQTKVNVNGLRRAAGLPPAVKVER